MKQNKQFDDELIQKAVKSFKKTVHDLIYKDTDDDFKIGDKVRFKIDNDTYAEGEINRIMGIIFSIKSEDDSYIYYHLVNKENIVKI